MKKSLSILLSACMLLTLAGCAGESGDSKTTGGNKTKESQNVSEGYNFIQPDIKLGMKLSNMPKNSYDEESKMEELYYGYGVDFEGIAFMPTYNWLGSNGESLNMIEYSARTNEEGYNKILAAMKEKYGAEPLELVDETLAEEDTYTTEPTDNGTPAPSEETTETPTTSEDAQATADGTDEPSSSETPGATEAEASTAPTAEQAETATPSPSSDATDTSQPMQADNQYPPLQWKEDGVLISLLYSDDVISIRFNKNEVASEQ